MAEWPKILYNSSPGAQVKIETCDDGDNWACDGVMLFNKTKASRIKYLRQGLIRCKVMKNCFGVENAESCILPIVLEETMWIFFC